MEDGGLVRDAGMGAGDVRNGEAELAGARFGQRSKRCMCGPKSGERIGEGATGKRASALWVVVKWGSELRTWGRWALLMHRCWVPGIEHPRMLAPATLGCESRMNGKRLQCWWVRLAESISVLGARVQREVSCWRAWLAGPFPADGWQRNKASWVCSAP